MEGLGLNGCGSIHNALPLTTFTSFENFTLLFENDQLNATN